MYIYILYILLIKTYKKLKYYRELVTVVLLKMNSMVCRLKSTNSHNLLPNTTIIPLCNGKISLIFL